MAQIITGGKMTGKKMVRAMQTALERDGHVTVATLSTQGIERINNAGQKVSNAMAVKIHAVPEIGDVDMGNGTYRAGLLVKFTVIMETTRLGD